MKIVKALTFFVSFPLVLLIAIPVGIYEIYNIWSKDSCWEEYH